VAINKKKALDAAQKFLQKGQIDKAITEYRKVCEADPDDLRSLQKLGDLYARQGHRQEAVATYMKLAEMLTARGFANRAVSIYKQILQLNPLLVPVYVKLSALFKELGLSKDARIFNQRAIEILQKTGNQDDLLNLLKRIVEGDPEDAISRITLAETYLRVGNTTAAVAELEAALPLLREQKLDDLFIRAAERLLYHYPDNIELCRELAVLHLRRNEVPRAMKLLLFSRKKNPEDVQTMDLLARHFISTGEVNKAAVVLAEKAKVHRKLGEEDLLRETYQRMVEIDPSDLEAKRALREASPQSPMPPPPPPPPPPARAAVDHAETEIPIFEDSIVGARRSSVPAPAHRSSPTPHSPRESFEKVAPAPAVAAGDDSAAAKYVEEVEIYMKYGLVDKAVEHLEEGVDRIGGNALLYEKLKDIHLDQGDMDQAIEHLFNLAGLLQEKEPGRAIVALKEILLIAPEQPRALRMLSTLDADGAPASAVEEIEEFEEIEDLEPEPEPELEPVELKPLGRPLPEAVYDSFLEKETSDPGLQLPSIEEAQSRSDPHDSTLERESSDPGQPLGALERESSDAALKLPSLGPEAEDEPLETESEDEMARALESVTLPELELEELDALETETEEFDTPTVPDLFDDILSAPLPVLEHEPEPAAGVPVPDLFPALEARPPVAPPPPVASADQLATSTAVEEALEEVSFFVQQGLGSEALMFLRDLLLQYPGNRLIEDKIAELDAGAVQPDISLFDEEPEPLLPPSDASQEVDMESDSQLADEAFDALSAIESIIQVDGPGAELSLGAQRAEIDPSDARTHYDLGIAYMEMGVTDSAVQEFRIASNAPDMEPLCFNMIGNCLMKAGKVEEAIKEYKLGLFAKNKTQDQELNLYYDIAEAYIKLNDHREAIYYLQNIKKKDVTFKDVKLKLIALSSSYKPTTRASSMPPKEEKVPSAKDPSEAAREVDDAFDDLFGDFGGSKGE
jgi:tetratricopeptide (TPR) repeat protein